MMRILSPILLSLAVACGGAAGGKVDQAIGIAKELKAKPNDAESILSQHGMTVDQWEALMFEIADDPAMAEKFEAGVK